MKVVTTHCNFTYACEELGRGFTKAMLTMIHIECEIELRRRYADLDRTLVVFKGCPCCSPLGCEIGKDDILVSPLKGIDTAGYKIHVNDVYPPFQRDSGKWEGCENLRTFAKHYEETIAKAIKETVPHYKEKKVKEEYYPHNF